MGPALRGARTPSEDGFHVASNVVNSARRILFALRRNGARD
ncbi:MAG: hypothetical protein ACTH2Q_08295 [Propionibacteriaceae bacterium]